MSKQITTAQEALIAQAIFQMYYRVLGMVSLHFGITETYNAMNALTSIYGGTLSYVVPGRVIAWNNLFVAPEYADSPTMSIWAFGSSIRQLNTVFVRKGFWTLYLPSSVTRFSESYTPRLPQIATSVIPQQQAAGRGILQSTLTRIRGG
ncbi:MAG: hypothetical protein QXP58_09650 [Thermoprotei archaeon]